MRRSGFTMIELIFVIVILGILAAVAIPKLSATKADAEATALKQNVQTCLHEAETLYFKNGSNTKKADVIKLRGCKEVNDAGKLTYADGGTTITLNGTDYTIFESATN